MTGIATGVRTFKNWFGDWPLWWSGLSPFRKFGPALFVTVYWTILIALHGLKQDHINICLALLALCYGGRILQPLLRFLLPLIATAITYDSQRFYSDYIRGPIHIAEPYNFDKYFFGIHTAQGVLTPNEWCQIHNLPVLDIITGFMYLFFIAIYVLFAAYFVFYKAQGYLDFTGRARLSSSRADVGILLAELPGLHDLLLVRRRSALVRRRARNGTRGSERSRQPGGLPAF